MTANTRNAIITAACAFVCTLTVVGAWAMRRETDTYGPYVARRWAGMYSNVDTNRIETFHAGEARGGQVWFVVYEKRYYLVWLKGTQQFQSRELADPWPEKRKGKEL